MSSGSDDSLGKRNSLALVQQSSKSMKRLQLTFDSDLLEYPKGFEAFCYKSPMNNETALSRLQVKLENPEEGIKDEDRKELRKRFRALLETMPEMSSEEIEEHKDKILAQILNIKRGFQFAKEKISSYYDGQKECLSDILMKYSSAE